MDFTELIAVGFVRAPYDGQSYKYSFGSESDGGIYLEDFGNDSFSVSVYQPSGHQQFFKHYENPRVAVSVAWNLAVLSQPV